jgi:hypothetical protein
MLAAPKTHQTPDKGRPPGLYRLSQRPPEALRRTRFAASVSLPDPIMSHDNPAAVLRGRAGRHSDRAAGARAYWTRWITPDAYASLHGVTRPTIIAAILSGRIKALRIRGGSKLSYAIDPAYPWPGKLREAKR